MGLAAVLSSNAPASAAQSADGARARSTRSTVTPEARAQAEQIFGERCVSCHGPQGRGDGPAAENLKPRPRDFHNRRWQKAVTDAEIAKAIVYGGSAVGMSGEMAPNPDLENEPGIVGALVERVRSLAQGRQGADRK
jgi:mono/diheme cytochrome c family protein